MSRLILSIFFLVSLLFFRFVTFYQAQSSYEAGDDVVIEARLYEEPELSNKGQKFSIKTGINQIIFITAKATPRFHYGDKIKIAGIIQSKELPEGDILLTLYKPEIVRQNESPNPLSETALYVRKKSKNLFEGTLPPTSASLLSGIVFGAKEQFPKDFKDSLSSTGVLHVIAASGMNVSFVAIALLGILSLFVRRQIALVMASLGIIFYVFLVGFEPSIIRAAIMAILALVEGILGRQNWAFFSIMLTAYVMLLWRPSFLFDVGFQLSFMATMGILLSGGLGKFGSEVFVASQTVDAGKVGELGKVRGIFIESFMTTLAAQVATLPILLGVFGSVGILGLLVNSLVLWVVPIVMTIGSVAVLVGLLIPPLAQMLLYLSMPFLLFFEAMVSLFGRFNWNFEVGSFPWPMSVGYYLIMASFVIFMRLKKVQK